MTGEQLLFTGDLSFDYDEVPSDLADIGSWIHKSGFKTIVNLEGPVVDPDPEHAIQKRGPNLSLSKTTVEVLNELNTVGVSLANNHMMDYGEYGLNSTIAYLDDNGIKHSGAGHTLDEALIPFVIDAGGLKVAVLSFGWDVEETRYATDTSAGCAPRNKEMILGAVYKAREKYDRIIVCIHWGFEFNRYPMPYDIDLAHAMIDAGADLIIGNHPHCVQPYEEYHNKTIFYSLGNFYFGSKRGMFTRQFKEKIKNQPDYGLIVIYDPVTEETRTHMIVYSREIDKSSMDDSKMDDILNVLPKLNEKEYLKVSRKARNNSTPVLTTDEERNKRLIRNLYSFYDFKKKVRRIINYFYCSS